MSKPCRSKNRLHQLPLLNFRRPPAFTKGKLCLTKPSQCGRNCVSLPPCHPYDPAELPEDLLHNILRCGADSEVRLTSD